MDFSGDRERKFASVKFVEGDSEESLWAVDLGNGLFWLENSPFFTNNISQHDILEASKDSDGIFNFVRVVYKYGNRTVRMHFRGFTADEKRGKKILREILRFGCEYEVTNGDSFSVTVPSPANLDLLLEYLRNQECLNFEVADYAEPLLADAASEPRTPDQMTTDQAQRAALIPEGELLAIDDAIISSVNDKWRKVARVVGLTMNIHECSVERIPDVFYAKRIKRLVEDGRLESQGNLDFMRFSEIRLPE